MLDLYADQHPGANANGYSNASGYRDGNGYAHGDPNEYASAHSSLYGDQCSATEGESTAEYSVEIDNGCRNANRC